MMMTKMGHEYKGDFLQDGEEEQKAYWGVKKTEI
jgi:hypothetical protein